MSHFGELRIGPVADDRYLTWDAAYVLGALAGDDRREYEGHLTGCARCRSAVAELSGIPGLLAMLDLDEVSALDDEKPDPPLRPEVLQSVLGKVSSHRRRGRWLTSAAVGLAAALLAVGIVIAIRPETIGLHTGPTEQASAQMLEMTKVSNTPINASIAMTGYGWGTRIDMACTYGDWGHRMPRRRPWAWWWSATTAADPRSPPGSAVRVRPPCPVAPLPMPLEEIAAVQMVSSRDGKVLLEKKL